MPGIYFHSLVGTRNSHKGVQQTGQNRTINRRKFALDELRAILADERSAQRMVFEGYKRLLAVRIAQPAFHPDAEQAVIDTGHLSLISFVRTSPDPLQRIVVLANVGSEPVEVDLAAFGGEPPERNLIDDRTVAGGRYEVEPFGLAWLA